MKNHRLSLVTYVIRDSIQGSERELDYCGQTGVKHVYGKEQRIAGFVPTHGRRNSLNGQRGRRADQIFISCHYRYLLNVVASYSIARCKCCILEVIGQSAKARNIVLRRHRIIERLKRNDGSIAEHVVKWGQSLACRRLILPAWGQHFYAKVIQKLIRLVAESDLQISIPIALKHIIIS